MPASVMLLAIALTLAQASSPLRKSDIVRLLSGSALSQPEVAELVARNCLTFDPTDRDRSDFRRLGADRVVLAAVDGCARRAAAPAAPPLPGRPAAARSGFVSGGGQRGAAGSRLARLLVFEVHDSAGAPLAGRPVAFTAVNARVDPPEAVTDASGAVSAVVTLGSRTGSATVLATVGAVEKQVAFHVGPGPAAQLVAACGTVMLTGRFAVRPDSTVTLHVRAQDAYANAAPLTGLRAAVADARIARVVRIAQDTLAGTVVLKPDRPGTTSLAVIANGLRQYLTLTVPPRAAPGRVDCS